MHVQFSDVVVVREKARRKARESVKWKVKRKVSETGKSEPNNAPIFVLNIDNRNHSTRSGS